MAGPAPLREMSLSQAAEAAGVSRTMICKRLARGMSIAEAVAAGRLAQSAARADRLDVPWEDDAEARAAVAERGALDERTCAAILGVSKARIGQITRAALVKLRAELEREGWEPMERYTMWDEIEMRAVTW